MAFGERFDRAHVEGVDKGGAGLTVFSTPVGRPALKMGPKPTRGDAVLALGYGGDAPMLLFYEGVFIHPGMGLEGTVFQFNSAQGLGGMSGGPLVDRRVRRELALRLGRAEASLRVPSRASRARADHHRRAEHAPRTSAAYRQTCCK